MESRDKLSRIREMLCRAHAVTLADFVEGWGSAGKLRGTNPYRQTAPVGERSEPSRDLLTPTGTGGKGLQLLDIPPVLIDRSFAGLEPAFE